MKNTTCVRKLYTSSQPRSTTLINPYNVELMAQHQLVPSLIQNEHPFHLSAAARSYNYLPNSDLMEFSRFPRAATHGFSMPITHHQFNFQAEVGGGGGGSFTTLLNNTGLNLNLGAQQPAAPAAVMVNGVMGAIDGGEYSGIDVGSAVTGSRYHHHNVDPNCVELEGYWPSY